MAFKLRVLDHHGQHGGQSLAEVLAGQVRVLFLERADPARIIVERLGQRAAEAHLVRAALAGGNVIDIAEHGLGISVGILHGHGADHIVLFALQQDGLIMQRGFIAVEIFDIIGDTARVAEPRLALILLGAFIDKGNLEALVQVGQLAQAAGDGFAVEAVILGKNRIVGQEAHQRAALAGIAQLLQSAHRLARVPFFILLIPDGLKAHLIVRPIAEGIHGHPFAQRVYHRRAHAVQAAGIGIVFIAELAARVQAGINQLDTRYMQLWMLVHRHAATVIPHRGGAILMQRNSDLGRIAGQGLVDAIVHDFPQQMMQSAYAGGADVHARAHADGVQPFQHLDFSSVVSII